MANASQVSPRHTAAVSLDTANKQRDDEFVVCQIVGKPKLF
ncbi:MULTISPECIES: hypothetical protein [unclassified Wolbachia]|nr:hypothetical protein [Wolbachia endosymbiont (group A) of Apoderus coryli]